jgi:hypothetical protein
MKQLAIINAISWLLPNASRGEIGGANGRERENLIRRFAERQ